MADRVVTLRAPLGVEAAKRTVRRFFEAVSTEDVGALGTLTSPTAVHSGLRNGADDRLQNFGFLWRQRFAKLDYTELDPATVYREADLETFEARHASELPPELRAAAVGETLDPDDVIVRVRILGQGGATERLFGDSMTFWLRRDDDRYVVTRLAEALPL
ncbi:MAG: hypothetical protein FJ096_01865 [Deltaproteobacteria bacterium]|nr:hypothetical protein [Deltaproteobacteria bacterium]